MDKFNSKLKELFGIDIRSLALFRIGLALVVIGDLLVRLQDLKAHYADEGILPRSFLIETLDPSILSLNMINGTWQFQLLLFIFAGISAFALLVGYKTRAATILTWIFVASLQLRNPMVDQGGDIVLKVLLFWGMFLPLGGYWSIDERLDGKKIPYEKQVVSGGTIALLLQVCFIYWFSALLKTDDSWTKDGTAVWYSLSIEQYSTPLGLHLLHYPDLLKFMTFATLYLEAFGPFFAFSPIWTGPIRFATAVIFILFHLLGLNWTMELALFPYVCAAAWIVFIPAWFWDRVLGKNELAAIPWKASWLSNALASFCLIYVFLWNISTLEKYSLSPPFPQFGYALALDQTWDMFAPYPLKIDGWYVIPALLRDGTKVDIFKEGSPIQWEKPPLLSGMYRNDRWRSYMMNLMLKDNNQGYLFYYAQYLCRYWNDNHSFDKQILKFDIFFMEKTISIEDPSSPYEKIHLWTHFCQEK